MSNSAYESFNCFGLFSLIGDKLQQQKDQYRLMLNGKANGENPAVKVKGSVVLQKKNVLDFNDFSASVLDKAHELLGKKVKLQLVSVSETDQENGLRGRLTSPAFLQNWVKSEHRIDVGETVFDVNFELDQDFGVPGAFIIENHHNSEFYLKELVLHDLPEGKGKVHFICNSWVYPTKKYTYDRVFFANQSYLPSETPQPLRRLRESQLMHKKGDGKGQLQYWDRVYDYAFYNDLGEPDKGKNYARTTLGGSTDYPYPRRGRTGRPPNKSDKKTESRLPLISLDVYVPRDERFGHLKMSDFLAYSLKAIVQILAPELKSLFDKTPKEFDTFQDVLDLYENSSASPDNHAFKTIMKNIPNFEMLKELFRADGGKSMKYPMPQVIENDKSAWRSDEEFGRETLAGVNPVCICRLKEFPPVSKLDVEKYGNQNSTIKEEHIVDNLSGLTVQEALEQNKLFILDYHDTFMTYLNRINSTTTKTYASRTLFFLKDDGTLTPIAIELSLPHPQGEVHGAVSEVYTPAHEGVEGSIWQLAKAYAAINDSGYHQLISHWLNTHAVIEPFVIATNRQLSELHPMYKLLQPHFRDTMNINALARQILINAGGVLETTVFPARYAMEMSAVVYKSWNFNKQALPDDLIERGMAVKDPHKPHGLRLMIEDYPYAVDGLEIWAAIETWVHDYCDIYYDSDHAVKYDSELQAWWQEIRYVGHGDKKDEPWWSKMDTKQELIKMVTIIIWVASALHAAVNFGQYPYAGYLPNRPTMSRQFMPKPGTSDYAELETNPDGVFLKTITAQLQTLLGISIIEVLSMHSSDEIYLGQNPNPGVWTANEEALAAFERFRERLMVTESRITQMNNESRITQMNNETGKYKNRFGLVEVPYTLLFPNTSVVGIQGGLTGKGIPNSVSI